MIPFLCTSDIDLCKPANVDNYGYHNLHNGIGRLTDCISCEVTEALNGTQYDATITIPISSVHYKNMILWSESNTSYTNGGGTIYLMPHPRVDSSPFLEPFDIVEITSDDSGVATILAQHVSRRLKHRYSNTISESDGEKTVTEVIAWLNSNMMPSGDFTFSTDFSVVSPTDYYIDKPISIFDLLLGSNSPFANYYEIYGKGEFLFTGTSVAWRQHRTRFDDTEPRFIAAYGKNIVTARRNTNNDDYHNAGIGYKLGEGDHPQATWGSVRRITGETRLTVSNVYDVTDSDSSINSAVDDILYKERTEKTAGYIEDNFEFAVIPDGSLQYASLGDYIHVSYSPFSYENNAKIVKTTFDPINERYTSMTVGSVEKTYGQTIKPYI